MSILILRLSSLGDILLLAPVLAELKKAYPDSHVAGVVKGQYKDLAAALAGLDEVIVYQGFWKTLGALRRRFWDKALDLHGVWRTRSLMVFLKAGQKVTYEKDVLARQGMVWLRRPNPGRHALDRYRQAFDRAGIKLSGSEKEFGVFIKSDALEKAQEYIQKFGLNPEKDFLIGLAPGAKWATKRWPARRFAELGRRLLAQRPSGRLLLLGNAEERLLCEEIAGLIVDRTPPFYPSPSGRGRLGRGHPVNAREQGEGGQSKVINLAGQVELGMLAGLVKFLRLLVANDSGIMHMGWVQGVSTVAIFGPTVEGFGFAPQGKNSRIVERQDLNCRPCSLHGGAVCPRGHFLCMELIGVEQVLSACNAALLSETI